MPTIITHSVAAWAAGKVILNKEDSKVLITGTLCSMLPDTDVISFSFGIPYESMWGHRGITHSFFFAFMMSLLLLLIIKPASEKRWKYFIYLFIAISSHAILDAFTNGGRGVAFFAPFDNERYFFPFTPIRVSPLGIDALQSGYGLRVFMSEIKWVWLPSLLLVLAATLMKSLLKKRRPDI